jgi:hypothetical protein
MTDRWMSQGFFPEKKYMQKNNTSIYMFAYTKVLHEYMHSLRNDVCNLFVNTHVRIKIYRKLYHGIIYTANIKLENICNLIATPYSYT